jgi:steroid delta-isomerase-like uncharacterized protein
MGIHREGEAPAEPLCNGRSLLALRLGRSLALPSIILSVFKNPMALILCFSCVVLISPSRYDPWDEYPNLKFGVRKMMMTNPNALLSKRWFEEVWNQQRMETVEELLTPTSVGHMESGDIVGIEAFKMVHAEFLTVFPDLQISIEGLVAEGDDVVVRWQATGTHEGDGFGTEATHQTVSFQGMTWLHFQEGKMVEGWDSWNQRALVEQLRGGH